MGWPVAAEGHLIIHQHAQQLRHQAAEQAEEQTQASFQQTAAQPGGISLLLKLSFIIGTTAALMHFRADTARLHATMH